MSVKTRKTVRIAVLVVSLGLCLSAGSTIVDLWRRKDLVRSRQREYESVTRENKELTQRLQDTKTNDYVERVARNKLGLVKDGETVVIVPGSQKQDAAVTGGDTPNWLRWWRLFF